MGCVNFQSSIRLKLLIVVYNLYILLSCLNNFFLLQIQDKDTAESLVNNGNKKDLAYTAELASENSEDDEEENFIKSTNRRKITRPAVHLQKLTTEEEELEKLIKRDFDNDKCPSQKTVEKVMSKSKSTPGGVIYKRQRDTIKKVSNLMIKRRKTKN